MREFRAIHENRSWAVGPDLTGGCGVCPPVGGRAAVVMTNSRGLKWPFEANRRDLYQLPQTG